MTRIAQMICCGLLVACGGDWEAYQPNPGQLPDNTAAGLSYPAGPFGTTEGDIIADLKFEQGFWDPGTFCKPATAFDINSAEEIRSLSFSDVRIGDLYCPDRKKQFLWLIASAGW